MFRQPPPARPLGLHHEHGGVMEEASLLSENSSEMHIPHERKHITLSVFSSFPPNNQGAEPWSHGDQDMMSLAEQTLDSAGPEFQSYLCLSHPERPLITLNLSLLSDLRAKDASKEMQQKVVTWETSLLVQWMRLPTNAGDTGLIPGLGRFHMLWSN